MEFWKVCYAVRILDEYKSAENQTENLETYFKRRSNEIKETKGFEKFITTHRMLLLGYMFGLIKKIDKKYENAEITEVYKEIFKRCEGNFENTIFYYDLLEQQIEKLYFSSPLDEKSNDLRSKYKVFPLFLLYKVLIEIGKITGKYEITKKEFIVFVCTTEKYSDYLSTVFNIMSTRDNKNLVKDIDEIYDNLKKDVRYHKILVSLNTIEQINDKFKIKNEYINYVKEKIYLYETSNRVNTDNYIDLLCSQESLVNKNEMNSNDIEREEQMDLSKIKKNIIDNKLPRNLIIYGAPGTGKSYRLEDKYRKKYFKDEYLYARVTLNSNYSYSDFVGVYKPTPVYIKNETDGNEYYASNKIDKLEHQMMPVIDYTFVSGPFIDILCKALNDSEHNYLLLIEEINRADVSSVFGDVFQMLDRNDKGESEYGIVFNKDIMNYISSKVKYDSNCFIKDKLVKIPSNMYLWATMNSADQNVVRMDTAFKRRWDFEYIGINDNENQVDDLYIKLNCLDKKMKWNDFRHELNTFLSENLEVSEDRLIGPYFIKDIEEIQENNSIIKIISQKAIKYKLLLYLKDDVLRHNSTDLFKLNYTFGKLLELYDNKENIFVNEFFNQLKSKIIGD